LEMWTATKSMQTACWCAYRQLLGHELEQSHHPCSTSCGIHSQRHSLSPQSTTNTDKANWTVMTQWWGNSITPLIAITTRKSAVDEKKLILRQCMEQPYCMPTTTIPKV